jgi:diguanylate cyclase (GGDEF)-like protein
MGGSLAFKGYLTFALAAAAAYFASPTDTWLQTFWFVGLGVLAGLAIVAGVRLNRPAGAAAWALFAVGITLNALGTLAQGILGRVLHTTVFPSVADVLYLGLYPPLIAGLAMLIRRRSSERDWGTLVDATTISTGLGLLSWVFFIRPAAGDPELGLLGHLVSTAYPVGDVVLLAMMVRLLLGAGSKTPAFRLMTASLLLFLLGDTGWAVVNQTGWTPTRTAGHLLEIDALLAYTMFAAAALHPSVRYVAVRAEPREPRLSRTQLGLLACASLIAPGLLIIEVLQHEVTDGVAIAVGSIVLFLLVVTRMAQLLRQVERQAGQLRELSLVDPLTALPNRRAWSVELPRAIERARRDGQPLCVAMLDLDHFKRFNDDFGHPAGDALLQAVASAWSDRLRVVDRLARYGGEEFIVLLPGAGIDQAGRALARLRPVTPAGQTFSAGLAAWDPLETSEELIARADAALYAAKRAGRNRTIVADAPRPQPAAA